MGLAIAVGLKCTRCGVGQDGTYASVSATEGGTDSVGPISALGADSAEPMYIWNYPDLILEGTPMATIANFASLASLRPHQLWDIIARYLPHQNERENKCMKHS